ncbi:MAG TPA: ATP-binding protein [Rhodocyclaceae bacterium]|nr:ATP-binding protein [Rhodocyclaceae bacterium]
MARVVFSYAHPNNALLQVRVFALALLLPSWLLLGVVAIVIYDLQRSELKQQALEASRTIVRVVESNWKADAGFRHAGLGNQGWTRVSTLTPALAPPQNDVSLTDSLSRHPFPPASLPNGSAALFDREGHLLAGDPQAGELLLARGTNLSNIADSSQEDTFDARTQDGSAMASAFSRSPNFGWIVAVGIPTQPLVQNIVTLWVIYAALSLVLLLAALRIVRAIGNGFTGRRDAGSDSAEPPVIPLAENQWQTVPTTLRSDVNLHQEAIDQAQLLADEREHERKRTTQALHASERRLRLAISTGKNTVFTLNRNLRITWIHSYRSDCDEDAMVGKTMDDLLPHEYAEPLNQLYRQVLETGKPLRKDMIIRRIGEEKESYCDVILEPLDEADDPDGGAILAVINDVTQRKREELIHEVSERFHMAVLNSLTEHIAVLDDKGIITAVNTAWERFAEANGAPQLAKHSVGLNYRCLYVSAVGQLGKDKDQQIWSAIDEVLTGKRSHFTLEYPFNAPGEPRIYRMNVYALPAPHRGAVVSHENITARKQMELALQRSEEELKRAQSMSHMGSWRYDLARKETAWSDEVYRILGLKPQSCKACLDTFLDRVPAEDRERVKTSYTDSLRNNRDGYEIEHRIITADTEEVRIVYEKCEHVRDAEGRFIYSLGMLQDITESKATELALKAAQAEAEQANNAKSRFLAAASHDLRQPLSALALYVGSLDGRITKDDGLLKNMRDCVDCLNEMLTDLLDLSKLEAGVVTPQVRDFSIDDMLAKIVAANAPKALIKHINLRCTSSALYARTDPVLFRRILGNLVSNAIRYTERGGILIGYRKHRGKTWVEVWDTGIGIPKDKTKEIFEEFKQLGNDERSRRKGSGLGLAIVARMAALLGLEIRVKSRLGKGSVFAVELPVGECSETEATPPHRYRPLRIALVEDDARVRDALVYALEKNGHKVVAAPTRRELINRLNGLAPDIVVSDYRLAGGRTGFDVITAVREIYGAAVPALIITGDTDPKLIRRMASKGVRVQYKPIRIDALQTCIEELTTEENPEAAQPFRQGFFWNF